MEKLVITGGEKLSGTVNISGAKNAVLPVMAACILGDTSSVIHNVPSLEDVAVMTALLRRMGVSVNSTGRHTLVINPSGINRYVAPYDMVRRMRASVCVLGPLLGRFGKAKVSMPGGCVIGIRPIDLHLKGIRALGVKADIEHGYIIASAKRIKGANIYLGGRFGSSVLATCNIIMCAVKAEGVTVIENAACEPEVVDLIRFLCRMGADIKGGGSPVVKVKGVKKLSGAEHTVIPDRIEAGTYMAAAAVTGGDIIVNGIISGHLGAVTDKLCEAGVRVSFGRKDARVYVKGRMKAVEIITLPYPGFPTDMQAQFTALAAVIPGISIITEKIYPERFMHVPELMRMAVDISMEGATAIVKGVRSLSGAPVMASDLRASAALVLAGLAARGKTEVNRIYHLDRGYEKMDEKLRGLGARIERVKV